MPPNRVLTDAEILILVNYMREAWAEPSQALSYETVAAGLQKCPPAREP